MRGFPCATGVGLRRCEKQAGTAASAPARQPAGGLQGKTGRAPGGQGRSCGRDDACGDNGMGRVRHWHGNIQKAQSGRRRWCDRSAQGAVHAGRNHWGGAFVASHHHFHAAHGAANHLDIAGLGQGRCHGHANEQRKPHQHEAGDPVGAAQGLHGRDYDSEVFRCACVPSESVRQCPFVKACSRVCTCPHCAAE